MLVILGGVSSAAIGIAFLVPAAMAFDLGEDWLAYGIMAVGVYCATVVGTYFAVALAAAAAQVLDGRDATVRSGLAIAAQRVGPIVGWALVLTTVNLVLQALRERTGPLGAILLGAASVAWGLATFLVVPIVALEGLGPLAALQRSTSLFRQKWGEQLVGTASIGLLFALLGIVPAAVLVAIGLSSGSDELTIALIVAGIAIIAASSVLGSAARAVFSVALYRYASGGGATGPFTHAELESAVARKA